MEGAAKSDHLLEEKMSGDLPIRQGGTVFDIFKLVGNCDVFGLKNCWEAKRGFEEHRVLLSFVPDRIRESESDLNALEAEIAAGAKFRHQSLGGVRRLWRNEEMAGVELQWVRGKTLEEMQQLPGTILESDSLKWLNQLGQALDYLHDECGVVHRDIRPDLVVIEEESGRATLGPPGLRQRLLGVEEKQSWMSPQQKKGEPAQVGDDVYAIGLLTLQMTEGWKRDEALDSLLSKTLSEDVSRRPRTVQEFVEGFRKAVGVELAEDERDEDERGELETESVVDDGADSRDVEDLGVEEAEAGAGAGAGAQAEGEGVEEKSAVYAKAGRVDVSKIVMMEPRRKGRAKGKRGIWLALLALVLGGIFFVWKRGGQDQSVSDAAQVGGHPEAIEIVAVDAEVASPSEAVPVLVEEEEVWSDGGDAGELRLLDEDGWGVKMRWVPPGAADLKNDLVVQSEGSEQPRKFEVKEGFWLGEIEVTELLWEQAVSGGSEGDLLPKVGVSWEELMKEDGFFAKLNERAPEGWVLRLPMRDEWEYAYLGNLTEEVRDFANLGSEGVKEGGPQGGWGLVDLHGSVWEWCSDEVSVDEIGGGLRCFMGGSWVSEVGEVEGSSWRWNLPEHRSEDLGFRIVMVRKVEE